MRNKAKNSFIAAVVIISLCFASCHSRQSPIHDLESLTDEIEQNYQEYTQEDWESAVEEFSIIEEEIEANMNDYTEEELKQIGMLKGRCFALFAKSSLNNFKNYMENVMIESEGFIDGLTKWLKEECKYGE